MFTKAMKIGLVAFAALAAACTQQSVRDNGSAVSGASARFFLPTGEPTNTAAPSLVIDANDAVHMVYPQYVGGGAFYAFCGAGCAGPDDVKIVHFPTDGTVHNAMLALDANGRPRVLLSTAQVASQGYGESGVGAEVTIGDGLIGTVAQQKKVLRLSDVNRDIRYGRTIRAEAATKGASSVAPEIPLPGLPDAQSHLGIPLLVQGELVGVLAVESRNALGFDEWHVAFLNIVGNQAAIAIDRMIDDEGDEPPEDRPSQLAPTKKKRTFRFYKNDDAIFVDEYLIKNVAARILWRVLNSYRAEQRLEFSNRELRLDGWLGLPPIKDNLESRLILLRKRLEQKCPDVRIPSCSRGHFRLEADCSIELVEA